MNDNILEVLYKEHKEVRERLTKIETSIKLFGGNLNQTVLDEFVSAIKPDFDRATTVFNRLGTWKDKILAVLANGEKLSAAEIADKIVVAYPELKSSNPHNIIAQYCSSMKGTNELSYIREGKKYLYFINKEQKENTSTTNTGV
jgi:hypothetical protein